MICTYNNFIIWEAEDGIRAIDESKNIRLKLDFNQDKSIQMQVEDMVRWIERLNKIKSGIMAKKK